VETWGGREGGREGKVRRRWREGRGKGRKSIETHLFFLFIGVSFGRSPLGHGAWCYRDRHKSKNNNRGRKGRRGGGRKIERSVSDESEARPK